MSKAVVFDLDGVLADNSKALHAWLDGNDEPDWDEWYATLHTYSSRPEYVALARLMREAGYLIIVMTGRPNRLYEWTAEWLQCHLPFGYDRLIMWDENVYHFMDCKQAEMEILLEDYEVVLAIDNEEHWCSVFRQLGVPTIHASEGYRTIHIPEGVKVFKSNERMLYVGEG